MSKKRKTLPVAATDDDLKDLQELQSKMLFNPSRSEIACGLYRYAMLKVKQGEVSMETISHLSAGNFSVVSGEQV
jgi:hypothetical protein